MCPSILWQIITSITEIILGTADRSICCYTFADIQAPFGIFIHEALLVLIGINQVYRIILFRYLCENRDVLFWQSKFIWTKVRFVIQ